MTNLKMQGIPLHQCPEIEQLKPCIYFGKGVCPDCYAEPLHKLRKATSKHVHKKTSKKGVVRLGTYIEVLPEDWEAFKRGEGKWNCCGEVWKRPDFCDRPYILITRGLLPFDFYVRVAQDKKCINIQVSTDILADGTIIPSEERLKLFASIPKVIFRAKSHPCNLRKWTELFNRIQLSSIGRVMETPLRSRVLETKLEEGEFAYGKRTLLEDAGWDWHQFMRCNTKCRDCKKENGFTACLATPAMTHNLLAKNANREPPPRHTFTLHHIKWAQEARLMLMDMNGEATVREAYTWFAMKHPELVVGKPNWQFKVRVAIQRVAVKGEAGKWVSPEALNIKKLEAYV